MSIIIPAQPKFKLGQIILVDNKVHYQIVSHGDKTNILSGQYFLTYNLKIISYHNSYINMMETFTFSTQFIDKFGVLIANDLDSFKAQLL